MLAKASSKWQVTLADLHEVAAARLDGWAAWVASRNTMDEGDECHEDTEEVWPSSACTFRMRFLWLKPLGMSVTTTVGSFYLHFKLWLLDRRQ